MTLSRETFFKKIDDLVRTAGFAFICIGQDDQIPSFAYTVGLTETYGCPELMIFGVGDRIANVVFHEVAEKIKAGVRLADGDVLEQVLNLPCTIRAISDEAARPFALHVFSRYEGGTHTPMFQQIVYPDQVGVLPWEPGYDEGMRRIQLELWAVNIVH